MGSGTGSNFQSILDAISAGELDAEVVLVLSDHANAGILDKAKRAGIAQGVIDCRGFKTKFPEEAQREVAQRMTEAGADMICLAGFMRLVREPLLEVYGGRMLNIHPSLLPEFPGLESWKQALDSGAQEAGCTVHLVDAGMDTGPILIQARVPVKSGDTAASLHARIQVEEHRIYPLAIKMLLDRLEWV